MTARAAMLHLQGAALAMHPLHGPATPSGGAHGGPGP